MKNLFLFFLAVGLVVFAGCTSFTRPTLLMGVIENGTGRDVAKVQVLHLPTRIRVVISEIPAGRSSEIAFSPKVMQADEAVLVWIANGRNCEARLTLPKQADDGETGLTVLVYKLLPGGQASVRLKPVEGK
jgi:hypothetical protein